MRFRQLFIKEFKSIVPLYMIISMLVVLWHLFILYKSHVWNNDVIFITSLLLPLLLLAAAVMGTCYYQLHTEWKSNTIFLLLSLPIRGWKVLTAKLAAVISLLLITCLCIVASFSIILLRTQLDDLKDNVDVADVLPTLLNITLNGFWMGLLGMIFLLIVTQFAFLSGQLVAKLKWLVMFSAFLGTIWVVFRLSPLLSNLLHWTPDIYLGDRESDVLFLHSGPFIILLLFSIGILWLSGYILEQEVEV